MEGFTYATSLDLNMGYYYIKILHTFSALCTIVLPWGTHKYLKLSMGLCNSPDIFQENMSKIYINDLLLITNGDWDSYLEKLDKVLDRLKHVELK
eukprot:12289554-Ditylum_brightwellii.AAC.1